MKAFLIANFRPLLLGLVAAILMLSGGVAIVAAIYLLSNVIGPLVLLAAGIFVLWVGAEGISYEKTRIRRPGKC